MYAARPQRIASALAALAMLLSIVIVLTVGLRVRLVPFGREALTSIDLPPPPAKRVERPRVEPRRVLAPAAKEAPSPRNLRNRATPVLAAPTILLVVPPPIVAATQPAAGQAASSGASNVVGPGQGAGGVGDGFGGGGEGGDGGGGGVAVTGPRQIRGRLSFSDLPDGMLQPGARASVGVRYTVTVDGRVGACRAERPSGFPMLDALTCRLIVERFRFRPARDARRRPVPSVIVETHSWFIREEDAKDAG